MAGEIAEQELSNASVVSERELAQDREIARSRASAVHMWASAQCYLSGKWETPGSCTPCDEFLESTRGVVRTKLTEGATSAAVMTLAERLDLGSRLSWGDVVETLSGCGLDCGSLSVQSLPAAPPAAGAP